MFYYDVSIDSAIEIIVAIEVEGNIVGVTPAECCLLSIPVLEEAKVWTRKRSLILNGGWREVTIFSISSFFKSPMCIYLMW